MSQPVADKTDARTCERTAEVRHIVVGAELGVVGSICASTSSEVRSELTQAIGAGEGDLVVHLSEAEVWDATGLGVIVGAHRRAAAEGRRLVVADASPRLRRLMCATKLDRHLEVERELTQFAPLAATA